MSRGMIRFESWRCNFGLFLLIILVAFCAGCGLFGRGGKTAPEGDGKEVHFIFTGIERLNSCGEEAGNALSVRILQLKSDGALTGVSLTQLWDHEADELGDELIDQQEVVLDPGTKTTVSVLRKANTRYMAVAANFCKPDGSCWRWIRPTGELKDSVKLTFDEFCIQEARAARR